MNWILEVLQDLESHSLRRSLKKIKYISDRTILINEKKIVEFCSNDYLGLSHHPKVIEAAQNALQKYGLGSGASRLITGNHIYYEELEHNIAQFKNTQASIVFSSGYAANLGIISSLVGKGDIVFFDRLSHASLIDGCRLSQARHHSYEHNDINRLGKLLRKYRHEFKNCLILTEGIFSMDGDIASIPDLIKLAEDYNAFLLVDEAHSTGVLGENGRGVLEFFKISNKPYVLLMGTLSKALGALGGFLAATQPVIDLVLNKARSLIYSTALPPAICCGANMALKLIQSDNRLIRKLHTNIKIFSEKKLSPIIPVIAGSAPKALITQQELFKNGFFLPAIRYPTVPKGTDRIRISISSMHTKKQILQLKLLLQKLKLNYE